eukprot:GHVU01057983.1.p1 GENE.GHVU01057983.1~~GHVU01057983.1.p1  ORF type:complete len:247 (+),score=6.19 GHVU01057983.1:407-1147(+)
MGFGDWNPRATAVLKPKEPPTAPGTAVPPVTFGQLFRSPRCDVHKTVCAPGEGPPLNQYPRVIPQHYAGLPHRARTMSIRTGMRKPWILPVRSTATVPCSVNGGGDGALYGTRRAITTAVPSLIGGARPAVTPLDPQSMGTGTTPQRASSTAGSRRSGSRCPSVVRAPSMGCCNSRRPSTCYQSAANHSSKLCTKSGPPPTSRKAEQELVPPSIFATHEWQRAAIGSATRALERLKPLLDPETFGV